MAGLSKARRTSIALRFAALSLLAFDHSIAFFFYFSPTNQPTNQPTNVCDSEDRVDLNHHIVLDPRSEDDRAHRPTAVRVGHSNNNMTAGNYNEDEDTVKVVVGCDENIHTFQHSRICLRMGSAFFDAMFSHHAGTSGMKESQTGIVKFPDKSPSDWRLVAPFFEVGVPTTTITPRNARNMLEWNELLAMKNPVIHETCDKVFHDFLTDRTTIYCPNMSSSMISIFLEATALCIDFELPRTKKVVSTMVRKALGNAAGLSCLCSLRYMVREEVELWDFLLDEQWIPPNNGFTKGNPEFEQSLLDVAGRFILLG